MSSYDLRPPRGARTQKKRVGRGPGSGRGGRCGRGNKGQNARSGGGVRLGFEGGQMPLYRRIARRGFSNARFRPEIAVVNLKDLERKYEAGQIVNAESLYSRRLVRKKDTPIKILGNGKLSKKLIVEVEKISSSARQAVLAAGGEIRDSGGGSVQREAEAARAKEKAVHPKGAAKTAEKEAQEAENEEANDEGNGE